MLDDSQYKFLKSKMSRIHIDVLVVHEPLFFVDGQVAMCRCGFDPWEELGTDNSGPNFEDIVYEMIKHLNAWGKSEGAKAFDIR